MSLPITITPSIPPAPYVLADPAFTATLADCEKRISELKITTPASAQIAADLQVRLTRAGKELEAKRAELLRPALDWQALINSTARPVATRIDAAKKVLSDGLSDFKIEQDRIAAEAERARQSEIARLERIRLAEEKEAKRKSDEIAQQLATMEAARLAKLSEQQKKDEADLAFPDELIPEQELSPPEKTETEKMLEAVKFAPAVAVAAPSGVSFKETLVIDTIDVAKLPDIFVTRVAKEAAIRASFCTGWASGQALPECAGVTFRIDRKTVSTGRAKF